MKNIQDKNPKFFIIKSNVFLSFLLKMEKFFKIKSEKYNHHLDDINHIQIINIETNLNFNDFNDSLSFATRPLFKIANKHVIAPRLNIAYGEEYNAPTVNNSHFEMPPHLAMIRNELESYYAKTFKQAMCNWYKHGDEYIGFHGDRGNPSIVASLSFYQQSTETTRSLTVKSSSDKIKIPLKEGELLVMYGSTFQSKYKHAVLKQKNFNNCRLNITFRHF